MPGEFYAEVSYICAPGFDFDNDERNVKDKGEKFNKLYCSEGRWEGLTDGDTVGVEVGDSDVEDTDDYDEDDLASQNYEEIKAKYIIPTD